MAELVHRHAEKSALEEWRGEVERDAAEERDGNRRDAELELEVRILHPSLHDVGKGFLDRWNCNRRRARGNDGAPLDFDLLRLRVIGAAARAARAMVAGRIAPGAARRHSGGRHCRAQPSNAPASIGLAMK